MKTIKIKRKISSTLLRIKELEKFKGKNVEIKLDVNEIKDSEIAVKKNLSGIFAQYANKDRFHNEKLAWEITVKEKHECNNTFS